MTERILVIKHGAFGDVVQGFDAFASLRHSCLDAEISVLTTRPYQQLLQASGWFDECLVDQRAPAWNVAQAWRIRCVLHGQWNKIIDLQCSRRTAAYARLVGPNTRWFGTAARASDPMPDFSGVTNRKRMLAAVCMAGARETEPDLAFLAAARPPVQQTSLQPSYALILPGTSAAKPSKRWPAERYIELAQAFAAEGIQPVLGGSALDRPTTSIIAEACPSCLDLTGQTDLFSLAGLAAQACFVIGNDTGPVFLAARLNAPTLMLMGGDTDPSLSAPYGDKARWLKTDRLDQLPFDQVWEAVKSVSE